MVGASILTTDAGYLIIGDTILATSARGLITKVVVPIAEDIIPPTSVGSLPTRDITLAAVDVATIPVVRSLDLQ